MDGVVPGTNIGGTVERLEETPVYKGLVQAIIMDWAGTMADEHVLAPATCFYEAFKKHGIEITMEEARIPMGLRKDLHIKEVLEMPQVRQRWIEAKGEAPTQETVDYLYEKFVPMQLAVLDQYTALVPGAAEAVSRLQAKGIKIGTTTGFTKDMVAILLKGAEKQGYVPDSNCAGDQVPYGMGYRPAPFMLYQNLLNMGVWPVQSVVKVDDTCGGIGEGLSAGCWTVGVYGVSNYTNVNSKAEWAAMSQEEKTERKMKSKEILQKSGAHYLAETTAEIETIVQDINSRLENGEKP